MFDNYRDFLNSFFKYKKENTRGFSMRTLSKRAGFSAPGYFKLVADEKRNLSDASISKVARALSLTSQEAEFFEILVLFNQSETPQLKAKYYSKLIKNRQYQSFHPIEKDQYDYFTRWYYPVIREMVATKAFKEDPEWIASKLVPPIKPKQAYFAIGTLLRLAMLKRDEQGKLHQAQGSVTTGKETLSLAVAEYHRNMIAKAGEAIDEVSAKERDISSITFTVKSKDLSQLKDRVIEIRKQLLSEVGDADLEDDQVYELNIQLFPVTKKLT